VGLPSRLGIKTDHGILDVTKAGKHFNSALDTRVDAVYALGLDAMDALNALVAQASESGDASLFIDEDSITYAPVVPNPGKILCVGLNYSKHAAESGMAEPKYPVLFSKFNNTIAAPNEDVPLQDDWQAVDYEAELGVVIGKTARNVSEAEALDYVLGYCNMNDLSERDLQMLSGQWLLGKTLDKFLPLGPYVVTSDVIKDPQTLSIKGWLNGELRQNSNTSDMIFSVAQVIAYASKIMTLSPGDVISTGTPEGVVLGMDPKVWVKAGDEYTVEVEGLGKLTNKMIEA
jgi:2-keto-4-pentenoate hydratase/2-oxohepta-3-ene-1,7-dioic acid hydratase in catechol pathway